MDDVAAWVSTLIGLFIICVIGRVILSWVTIAPVSPVARGIVDFFHDTTDWYLRAFRRVIPPFGPLDLSPMIAILVLIIVQRFSTRVIAGIG